MDKTGFVLADHGMNSTLRDLGRLGLLVMNEGVASNKQVIPKDFIHDLHEQNGDPYWPYEASADEQPYYRSFWWGKGNNEKDLNGVGIHGQFLRVAKEAGIVIVIYSTWPRADGVENDQFWDRSEDLLDAIVAKFR